MSYSKKRNIPWLLFKVSVRLGEALEIKQYLL